MLKKLMEYEFKKFGKELPENVFGFISFIFFGVSVLLFLKSHGNMIYLVIGWLVSMFLGFLGYRISEEFVKNHK